MRVRFAGCHVLVDPGERTARQLGLISFLKGQRGLILGPIDDLENHFPA
jgi:hypothetical protein